MRESKKVFNFDIQGNEQHMVEKDKQIERTFLGKTQEQIAKDSQVDLKIEQTDAKEPKGTIIYIPGTTTPNKGNKQLLDELS